MPIPIGVGPRARLCGDALICGGSSPDQCAVGQPVTDQEGKTGVIVSDNSNLCQVKYGDGHTYGWIFWNLRPAAEPTKSGSTALNPVQPNPVTRPACDKRGADE
jgi:hypothetical protein